MKYLIMGRPGIDLYNELLIMSGISQKNGGLYTEVLGAMVVVEPEEMEKIILSHYEEAITIMYYNAPKDFRQHTYENSNYLAANGDNFHSAEARLSVAYDDLEKTFKNEALMNAYKILQRYSIRADKLDDNEREQFLSQMLKQQTIAKQIEPVIAKMADCGLLCTFEDGHINLMMVNGVPNDYSLEQAAYLAAINPNMLEELREICDNYNRQGSQDDDKKEARERFLKGLGQYTEGNNRGSSNSKQRYTSDTLDNFSGRGQGKPFNRKMLADNL